MQPRDDEQMEDPETTHAGFSILLEGGRLPQKSCKDQLQGLGREVLAAVIDKPAAVAVKESTQGTPSRSLHGHELAKRLQIDLPGDPPPPLILTPVGDSRNGVVGRFPQIASQFESIAVVNPGDALGGSPEADHQPTRQTNFAITLESSLRLKFEFNPVIQSAKAGTNPAPHLTNPIRIDFKRRRLGRPEQCQGGPHSAAQNQAGVEEKEAA